MTGGRGSKTSRGTADGQRGYASLLIILGALGVVLLGTSLVFYLLLMELPSIAALKDFRPSIATRVYDDNNELIDEFFLEDRKVIKLSECPRYVIQAFVAAEDTRFFEHRGLDYQSITRAFFKNLAAGHIVQGGSTITQQVAKALYLSPERSYRRKIKEALLAYKIDRYLTKEEILNLYLNYIYLGHGTYGIEAASQGYFGKSARHLTLSEVALLAGLPKAPNNFSPFLHPDRSLQRQAYVLQRMLDDGYITAAEKERALATPLRLRSVRPKDKVAAYFVEHVRRYIMEKYGSDVLYKEGLEVYTTLNLPMQKAARDAVERGLQEMERRQGYAKGLVQGALLCMDARTGAVRAMVGGRDFSRSEFNRATQSRRQPGSAFKPFIYTAAFDKGLTPSTIMVDSPISFAAPSEPNGVWQPKNFDGTFLGPMTLRHALVHSRNVVTIKVLKEIGVDYAAGYAANMGIASPLARNLTLALGSSGVTLLEMVRAYGVLANQGQRATPLFIKKIVDRTGQVFEENQPMLEQVIDPRIAFMSAYVMQDVVEQGTGARVRSIGRPVAAKTGTTNDMRDAWFMGFTPSFVTGVWVGFDQERSLGRQEVGGRAAAPIWLYFMEKAVQGTPVEVFPVPEGISFVKVDPNTGASLPDGTQGGLYESFLEGTTPEEVPTYGPADEQEGFF
ncbi:MAG: PBP1A family penicillin-binding protein [Syntrophales bacterium]|nr:PBP1A family penicillin-binding protein [Syntrophales bacterium]HPB70212.1 PBP1A family penicillin-binding protein [Syntrophales bacterium]HQN25737.1 PBP1A family penicillin-binding protein [Syntrophales bacterium]HQP28368.1 PBP1A family penicillin-binding protein [Syntrophales bacterium]